MKNIISTIKSKSIRWAEHVAQIRTKGLQGLHSISTEKLQGSSLLGRSRCIWKDNDQTDLQELGMRV
jgi:hypothetical protein